MLRWRLSGARGGLRSLQGRLLLWLLAGVVGVWLASAALTWRDAQHALDELLDAHLAQAAALLLAQPLHAAPLLEAPHGDAATPLPADAARDAQVRAEALITPQSRYASTVAFQIFRDGRLLARSAQAPQQPLMTARGWHKLRQQQRASAEAPSASSAPAWPVDLAAGALRGLATVRDAQGRIWRVYATPGLRDGDWIYVAERTDQRLHILLTLLRSALWPLALGLPLLALLSWAAVRHGLRPLRELAELLTRRQLPAPLPADRATGWTSPGAAAPDLTPLALPDGRPLPLEVVPLVQALNALLARMDLLLQAERRFTADAAHELRTPVAAIRAQAQVALAETDDALRRHALQATLAGCDRAGHLVAQLLTLARLEATAAAAPVAGDGRPGAAAPARLASQPLDLAAISRALMAEGAPQALDRGQTLDLQAPTQLAVQLPTGGDATLLRLLLRNLLDNACRYSPDGARIQVQLHQLPDGRSWCWQIDDSGPGLAPADIARLGERFFRGLGHAQPGSGLGWSIVRRVAAVLGLTVQAEPSATLGGLRVRVCG